MSQRPIEGAPSEQRPDVTAIVITRVGIETKLAEMCGIPTSQLFFSFDATKLEPTTKERLDKLAECATTGAAQGRTLRVVGFTDPVGDPEYNKQLGMGRAESVAKYLAEQGVKQARTETVSKGEIQADAGDPTTWPLERRVTIRLDETGEQPR